MEELEINPGWGILFYWDVGKEEEFSVGKDIDETCVETRLSLDKIIRAAFADLLAVVCGVYREGRLLVWVPHAQVHARVEEEPERRGKEESPRGRKDIREVVILFHIPLWIRCSKTSQWPYSAAIPNGVTPNPSLKWTLPPWFSSRDMISFRPCLAASCIADHRFTQGWSRLVLCLIRVDTMSKEPFLTAWRWFLKRTANSKHINMKNLHSIITQINIKIDISYFLLYKELYII